MAYTSGDVILDTHYNGFATDVNSVWGTGTGDTGYGQSTTLSSVTAGNTVTATQWSTLLARISSSASHQATGITAITSPVATDPIAAYAALSGNITSIGASRLNKVSNGTVSSSTGANTTDWITSLTISNTLTFAGGNEARYFFNAGGYIDISTVHGAGNAKDNEWNDLCTKAANYLLNAQSGGKSGGTGTPVTNLTATGYYDLLDNSDTIMFQQAADTAPYTANYYRVSMQSNTDDATDGLGNNGTVITITVLLQDDAADQAFNKQVYTLEDNVTGTTTTTFSYYPPETTYLTNTWGTPVWGTAVVTPVGAAQTSGI